MLLSRIHALLDAVDGGDVRRFPPTLLYNEGWLLRLALDWFASHPTPKHVLGFEPGATWFSEALLPTPFAPRRRGDPLGEARTHADGLIGHIVVGKDGKADAGLAHGATQLVVAEAKLNSPLSGGTRHAAEFDQAARTIGCMAELLRRAGRPPGEVQSLEFVVLAPQSGIERGGIARKLDKGSIDRAVRARAGAFGAELDTWVKEWFAPTLEAMSIESLSWEKAIGDIASQDPEASQAIGEFYRRCRTHNASARRLAR